jgi:hypothetical protein
MLFQLNGRYHVSQVIDAHGTGFAGCRELKSHVAEPVVGLQKSG